MCMHKYHAAYGIFVGCFGFHTQLYCPLAGCWYLVWGGWFSGVVAPAQWQLHVLVFFGFDVGHAAALQVLVVPHNAGHQLAQQQPHEAASKC